MWKMSLTFQPFPFSHFSRANYFLILQACKGVYAKFCCWLMEHARRHLKCTLPFFCGAAASIPYLVIFIGNFQGFTTILEKSSFCLLPPIQLGFLSSQNNAAFLLEENQHLRVHNMIIRGKSARGCWRLNNRKNHLWGVFAFAEVIYSFISTIVLGA